jgi:hypothetical protein
MVSEIGPHHAAMPAWTELVRPFPAQTTPSFVPYGKDEFKTTEPVGRIAAHPLFSSSRASN